MKKFILPISFFLISLVTNAQENKNVIMTIDGRDITSEEFIRVYSKNNNITPESEKRSVDEYLDLFINFKLKVIEAENKGYDKDPAFISELDGYKNQLAKPYIQSKELKEQLIKEAYEHSLSDVRVSHIIIRLNKEATPTDTLIVFDSIMKIRNRILAGEAFEKIAAEYSEEELASQTGGDLGYFSAFRMVYPFEKAAYTTPVGKVSMPIRTRYGYHLIKVTDKRPSRGLVNVSHIMVHFQRYSSEEEKQTAKDEILKIRDELINGGNWDEMVQKYSENEITRKNNGNIGWIKSGRAPANFLDSCFKLEPGQYSNIIETIDGYHIVKLLEKKPIEPFEEVKDKIAENVDSDKERLNAFQYLVNANIRNKYGFELNTANAMALASVLDSSIYKYAWNAEKAKEMTAPVVKVGDKIFNQYDFALLLAKADRSTIDKLPFEQIVSMNINPFTDECLFSYATDKLPDENLDYKYLLKEYHDGILLFNLTNDLVWKKAQSNTAGLEAFYKTAKKYNWNPRIETIVYEYSDSLLTQKLPVAAKKHAKTKAGKDYDLKGLCINDSVKCVKIKVKVYEKGIDSFADKLTWEKGSYICVPDKQNYYFYYVKNILPESVKKLNEARGLYIADYQNYLENEWVKQLREKYKVVINDSVLNDLKTELSGKE